MSQLNPQLPPHYIHISGKGTFRAFFRTSVFSDSTSPTSLLKSSLRVLSVDIISGCCIDYIVCVYAYLLHNLSRLCYRKTHITSITIGTAEIGGTMFWHWSRWSTIHKRKVSSGRRSRKMGHRSISRIVLRWKDTRLAVTLQCRIRMRFPKWQLGRWSKLRVPICWNMQVIGSETIIINTI